MLKQIAAVGLFLEFTSGNFGHDVMFLLLSLSLRLPLLLQLQRLLLLLLFWLLLLLLLLFPMQCHTHLELKKKKELRTQTLKKKERVRENLFILLERLHRPATDLSSRAGASVTLWSDCKQHTHMNLLEASDVMFLSRSDQIASCSKMKLFIRSAPGAVFKAKARHTCHLQREMHSETE